MKERSPSPERSQWPKLQALGEVFLVYLGLKILVKAYFSLPLAAREVDLLHWPYSVQLVSLGAALGMVVLPGRHWKKYGLIPNWREDVRVGGSVALLFIALPMAVMGLFGGLVPTTSEPGPIVSTVVFQFFLSGIGEEILYRGYIQSRLNRAFGRPLEIGGIRFGTGLFVSAVLFGLAHSLSSFNPFVPSFRFDLFYGVVTGIWAVLFGLLREKTGSVLSAGILHGHEAVMENFVMTLPGQLAYVVGFVVAFVTLLGAPVLRKRSSQEAEATTTGCISTWGQTPRTCPKNEPGKAPRCALRLLEVILTHFPRVCPETEMHPPRRKPLTRQSPKPQPPKPKLQTRSPTALDQRAADESAACYGQHIRYVSQGHLRPGGSVGLPSHGTPPVVRRDLVG